MTQPHQCPPRLTDEDALRIWRARDVHQVQSFLVGCLTLFVLLEVCIFSLAGGWYVGLLLVGLQGVLLWGLLRCLRWALRVTKRGLASWQARHNPPRKGLYADDHR
jgi:hypothetical protein